MRNRILTLGILFLLVFSTIIPMSLGENVKISETMEQSSMSFSRGKTLYVGGNGPGNYSKINDAYDDANPGDTIFVYSGNYNEYLRLEKTVNLIGEDKDTTSIIYNHYAWRVIRIEAPNVIVSGFTIYNPNPDLVSYVYILNEGKNASISNCIFYNSPLHFDDGTVGIHVAHTENTHISNCTFLYNDDEGVCLNVASSHNIVENCVFSHCGLGVEFQNSSHNIVDNCIMKDGHSGIHIGPYYGDIKSNNNLIKNCDIYNSEQSGISISDAYNNVIYNCSLDNNKYDGIRISRTDSYNNLIINNIINDVEVGLRLEFSCHDNIFANNYISNCKTGVDVTDTYDPGYCVDNLFYHNNFIDNNRGAFDECYNYWDNGYPSGGNYWSDYTGIDNDGDGIGDTPYDIIGGDNKDYYPLMEPWIADEPIVDANGPYYGLINEPIQFHGLAIGGYKPYTWLWDFGDTHTSGEQNPSHTYSEAGKYDVVLIVTDSHSNSSSDTTYAWIQETNNPPNTPTITGETHGKVGVKYEYEFVTTDPDENPLWYMVEWGDGTSSGWFGPYNSGQQVTLSHSWFREDTFTIKAKAKDPYNTESDWGTLEVTMPRNRAINGFFIRLLEQFPILRHLLRL